MQPVSLTSLHHLEVRDTRYIRSNQLNQVIILQRFLPPPPVSGMWPFSLMACLRGTEEVGLLNWAPDKATRRGYTWSPFCLYSTNVAMVIACFTVINALLSCVAIQLNVLLFLIQFSCNGTFSGSRGEHGPMICDWRRGRVETGVWGSIGCGELERESMKFWMVTFFMHAFEQFLQFHQDTSPPYS